MVKMACSTFRFGVLSVAGLGDGFDGEIQREAYDGVRVGKVVDVGRPDCSIFLAAKKVAVPLATGDRVWYT